MLQLLHANDPACKHLLFDAAWIALQYRICLLNSLGDDLFLLEVNCLTAIKNHVMTYCETDYERNGKNLLWSIKNSGEINKNRKVF